MIEDAGAMAAMSHRDARRRTRIAVAVYAVCLVTLLAIGAYLAPSGTVPVPSGGGVEPASEAR